MPRGVTAKSASVGGAVDALLEPREPASAPRAADPRRRARRRRAGSSSSAIRQRAAASASGRARGRTGAESAVAPARAAAARSAAVTLGRSTRTGSATGCRGRSSASARTISGRRGAAVEPRPALPGHDPGVQAARTSAASRCGWSIPFGEPRELVVRARPRTPASAARPRRRRSGRRAAGSREAGRSPRPARAPTRPPPPVDLDAERRRLDPELLAARGEDDRNAARARATAAPAARCASRVVSPPTSTPAIVHAVGELRTASRRRRRRAATAEDGERRPRHAIARAIGA